MSLLANDPSISEKSAIAPVEVRSTHLCTCGVHAHQPSDPVHSWSVVPVEVSQVEV